MTWGKVAGLVVALFVATLFNSIAIADQPEQPGEPIATNWSDWGTTGNETLDGNVILDGSTFSTKTISADSTLDGGGFIIDGGWSGGTATDGYRALNLSGTATIRNGNFQSCHYSGIGGAIYATGSSLTLSGTNTFTGNKANTGGVIYFYAGTLTLSGTNTFTGNKAGNGGAIYLNNVRGTVTLSGTNTFTGNFGSGGGAIYSMCMSLTLSGTNTFTGNTDSTGNNDIYCKTVTIQNSTECYFGGGISVDSTGGTGTGTLTMSKGTSTTTGPNVTFGPGSQTKIEDAFTMSDTNLTIKMGTAPTCSYNDKVDTTSGTTFSVKSLTATSHNSLTVYSTLTSVDTEDVITTTGGITGFENISPTLILPSGAPGYLYGEVLLSEDSKKIYVQTYKTTYTATNVANKEGGDTLSEAYGKGTLDTNYRQEIVLGANTQETASTTLTNDTTSTPSSWLSVHSNSEDVRTVSGANSATPIIKNEGGTTYLDANNVTFEGYTINATGQKLYLSGKNVTMNHKTEQLDSEAVVVAETFYLQNAEVTFGSKINANVISDLSSEITVGADSTKAEELTITGDFTSNGTIINLDIFQTGSDYTSASGNDSLMVGGTLLLDPSTKICLNPQTSFSTGDDFWVKITGSTVSDTTLANMQTILDRLASSGPFTNLEYVKGDDGAYYIHGQLVPEPSTWALLILGCAGMWWLKRSEKREARSEKK